MGIESPWESKQCYCVAHIKNDIIVQCHKTMYCKRKYIIWDNFFTISLRHALKHFFCTLSQKSCSQSLNCCLCQFTLPEALSLLKTCLFTSRAQQVFEQSARWKCGLHCCCETHLLKCSQFLKKTCHPFRLGCAVVCPPH